MGLPIGGALKATVLRSLIMGYLLALSVPFLAAMVAQAPNGPAPRIELCTADGVRYVAVDQQDLPDNNSPNQHQRNECPGCLTACGKLTEPAIAETAEPNLAAVSISSDVPRLQAVRSGRLAVHTPLPARGPPLSQDL